jgi:hypothetical protein
MEAETIRKYLMMKMLSMNSWRNSMTEAQKIELESSFTFQCKECEATPQGKNEDHYELCTCGAIAVSGGLYPKINTVYPDAYRYHYGEKE